MFKRLFYLTLILGFYLTSFSQNSISDSIILVENSSLSDSIEYELIQDTIRNILNINEGQVDAITLIDTIPNEFNYLKLMIYRNSILFEDSDTTDYIIYKLNKIFAEDSIAFSDSSKQAITKLMGFVQNQKIEYQCYS